MNVPTSVSLDDSTEYREMLYTRNVWFVKVRFLAIASFLLFLLSIRWVIPVWLTSSQYYLLVFVLVLLLSQNFIFAALLKQKVKALYPGRLNSLSLCQIGLDLLSLLVIVYATGGIESPFLYLFVFHVIISGLLLSLMNTAIITLCIILMVAGFAFMEYYGLIAHLPIIALYEYPVYNSLVFVAATLMTFILVLLATLTITTVISRDFRAILEKLLDALTAVEEAEHRKQRYVIAVVHEIKSPLTAVASYLRIVLQKILGSIPEPVEERLQRALLRTDEAVALTNTVLKISRMKLLNEMSEEPVDCEETITELLSKLSPVMEQKQIEVSQSRQMGKTFITVGDKFLLTLSFSNVLNNAAKYTQACGEIHVDISQTEDKYIQIMISDNGPGISQDDLPHVFRDFFRAKASKHENIEGMGVGLSVVKQIIEQHKGKIAIESPSVIGEENKPGVTVKVWLPLSGN